MARAIVFLSDYGLEDEFVGVCHGVVLGIAPEARVIDLTHGVQSQDVQRGAVVLAQNAAYFPPGTVFLAVVDPGVGSARRGIAVQTVRGDTLIGPDNGLLSLAWEALGGAEAAVNLTNPKYRLDHVSETFHGRDVFAPAAAHHAAGVALQDLGDDQPVADLVRLDLPQPEVRPGLIRAAVLGVDRYGNIELSAREQELDASGLRDELTVAGRTGDSQFVAHRARTFADLPAGELGILVDSLGWVSIVVNGGNAAEALGISPGETVELAAE